VLQVYGPPSRPGGFVGGHEASPVCQGKPDDRVRHGHELTLGEFTLGKADCLDLLLRETTAIEDIDQFGETLAWGRDPVHGNKRTRRDFNTEFLAEFTLARPARAVGKFGTATGISQRPG
jgi:hypothetical protein